jgi:hypothetical protein
MQSTDFVIRATAADGVVARRFGRETLLVPVCGGVGDLDSVYTLNEVGTTIWEALAEPKAIDDLVALVTREYDVTPERAREDIDAYLADLTELGLVRHAGDTAAAATDAAGTHEVRG